MKEILFRCNLTPEVSNRIRTVTVRTYPEGQVELYAWPSRLIRIGGAQYVTLPAAVKNLNMYSVYVGFDRYVDVHRAETYHGGLDDYS